MFKLGDNEDEEKMWNFILFKFYGTDKEIKNLFPTVVITILVVLISWLAIWFIFK